MCRAIGSCFVDYNVEGNANRSDGGGVVEGLDIEDETFGACDRKCPSSSDPIVPVVVESANGHDFGVVFVRSERVTSNLEYSRSARVDRKARAVTDVLEDLGGGKCRTLR